MIKKTLCTALVCAAVMTAITACQAEPQQESAGAAQESSAVETLESSSVEADSTYLITAAGTYELSGDISDTVVTVAAGKNDKVELVLDNVTIENTNGPAIYIQSADKVCITLKEGTVNTVSDGTDYSMIDGDTNADAAIFSRADLTINGSGTLNVTGNYKHGIVSKDDLIISDTNINAAAQKVGLNGKDCVEITNSVINVTAGSDGIRSDNEEDTSRGYVCLEGAEVNITAANDGIQAETELKASESVVTVNAGGGSNYALLSAEESYKGLKAGGNITISSGTYKIDSMDDCIHSNSNISITGGTFELASGDDGIHADTELSVSGGTMDISKSYEGLESSKLLISGGIISVVASDDGLNGAGGSDGSAMGGRFGQGGFSASTGEIIISGGYILVNASGDGIDANGNITVSGGVTLVSGPTSNGNAAFDYDGTATVTGGVLVALGSSGMAQGFTTAENQGAIASSVSYQNAGTSFALCDESGNVIVSFTPEKSYQFAVVTSPGIQSGHTYTIVTGAEIDGADNNGYAENTTLTGGTSAAEIEMTSTLYNAGGMGGRGGMGNPGGMGGKGGKK